jgi:hypothetical protein
MKALTKVLHKSFCCTDACRQLHFLGQGEALRGRLMPFYQIVPEGQRQYLYAPESSTANAISFKMAFLTMSSAGSPFWGDPVERVARRIIHNVSTFLLP